MATEQIAEDALVIERVNGDWPKWASRFMARLTEQPELYGEFVLDDLYDEAKAKRRKSVD